jgi:membrane protein implicated in regulation of membrane protease activity
MTLSNFFLLCFAVGFLLSLITFAFGSMHLHLPHHLGSQVFGHGAGHATGHGIAHAGGHAHATAVRASAQGVAAAGKGAAPAGKASSSVSPVNFMTVTAFLAWFGGVGYLVTHYYAATAAFAVTVASGGGVFGASIVFVFLAKVLLPHESQLDPADYEMVGTLATVSAAIHSGGTGEIQYTRGGARRSAAARSEDGATLKKGAEVIVARYEAGIAYVRLFDEMVRG